MRILVLDDDQISAAITALMLRQAGHDVVGPVATVQAVLDAARGAPPDLALLDVELGKGGSGIAAARGLARHFGVPSLFLTADVERAREAADAALGLVRKPVSQATLMEAVDMAERILAGEEPPVPTGVERFGAEVLRRPRPVRAQPAASA